MSAYKQPIQGPYFGEVVVIWRGVSPQDPVPGLERYSAVRSPPIGFYGIDVSDCLFELLSNVVDCVVTQKPIHQI
jgi:hypothetical protein